jgi:mono/diheme cytochrome c family protein
MSAAWVGRSALMAVAAMAGLAAFNPAHADQDNYAAVARGKALATAGDCVACHTAPKGQPFAGGLALSTPFGVIMTANLTPDAATGIGRWSADDFARAMHEGVRPDGAHLYPAFPYTYYTKVRREDSDSIYAFLRSLTPVTNIVDRSTLPFPFNIRASMMGWNALFFTPGQFAPDPQKSEIYNRGAYLVEGLGHCGACHTPMNAMGASKFSDALQANKLDNWTAPNITADSRLGLGKWSVEDIVTYLKTGGTKTSIATGPMAEVISNSTSQMPEEDLKAIATYLKERGAAGSAAPAAIGADDKRMVAGRAIFVDTCAACHTATGTGIENIFPRLAGNPIVVQNDPSTLIRVVMTGTRAVATDAKPTAPAMPSLGYRLSDEQLASVVTYIRNSWGNAAAPVAAADVGKLRTTVGAAR